MKTLRTADPTQQQIIAHLRTTEQLLAEAATLASGRAGDAEITPMPDLGLPHNVRRIHGGFFTGALYQWDSGPVPLIPVDATVNLCGVTLFRVEDDFEDEQDFRRRVEAARETITKASSYVWNFTSGNHFVILAENRTPGTLPEGRYLVLHASAAEFKNQYNGLYPASGNWYSDEIRILAGRNGRYLRYLTGKPAERFARVATMLESYQRERQQLCATLIMGSEARIHDEVLSLLHYGMPDTSSIAIGCQWLRDDQPRSLLLTRPGAPLYLVRFATDGPNRATTQHGDVTLTPHGLGVHALEPLQLAYHDGHLSIAGRRLSLDQSLAGQDFVAIRGFDPDTDLARIFDDCPGVVETQLQQIYSYHRTSENP
ncbi:hypothetical protein [Streptomyces sp. NPDC058202]|uniref:hypothetical protein n=1 Tax=Streptomyces sp. NPDC058202 TaxID=3346380 RepID=UPI0036ED3D59